MTHRSLIQRTGLAGGVALIAASGILAAGAAGGTSAGLDRTRPNVGCATIHHTAAGRCRWEASVTHHGPGAHAIEHRRGHDVADRAERHGSAARRGWTHVGDRGGYRHHAAEHGHGNRHGHGCDN